MPELLEFYCFSRCDIVTASSQICYRAQGSSAFIGGVYRSLINSNTDSVKSALFPLLVFQLVLFLGNINTTN